MTVLVPAACMALLAGFLGVIVYPVLTSRHVWQRHTGSARVRLELTERKEQFFASIKELEFDHSLGKISTEDYTSLRAELETDALAVLKQLDGLDGSAEAEDGDDLVARIEDDVEQLRDAAPTAPGAPAAPRSYAFCPSCGQARATAHQFCPHCGGRFDDTPAATS